MPLVDTRQLQVIERLPGWRGRYFHSANMTFAHYEFKRGSSIHEHHHPQEEVYEVLDGALEITIEGVVFRRSIGLGLQGPQAGASISGTRGEAALGPAPVIRIGHRRHRPRQRSALGPGPHRRTRHHRGFPLPPRVQLNFS